MCAERYTGETGRSLGARVEEHEKSVEKKDSKSALVILKLLKKWNNAEFYPHK